MYPHMGIMKESSIVVRTERSITVKTSRSAPGSWIPAAALGDLFDLKAFHRVILQASRVPLTILEQVVQSYIDRKIAER
jgi:hypothetical protein